MMNDFTISIYCLIDDFLEKVSPYEDPRRKASDSEIITTVLVAARYFGGNYTKARSYMSSVHQTVFPHKSNFNRILHRLTSTIHHLFYGLASVIKQLNTESIYLIDSFPVETCKNIRISRSKLIKEEVYRGYNQSKKEYFYGFKVEVITDKRGIPIDCYFVAGSYHDITAFQAMNISLPEKSVLIGDSGYTDYELEDLYQETENISLWIDRKKNSLRKHSPSLEFLIKKWRKTIETTFSEITTLFPKRIHAVTVQGFILKVFCFILTYSFKRVIQS